MAYSLGSSLDFDSVALTPPQKALLSDHKQAFTSIFEKKKEERREVRVAHTGLALLEMAMTH